MIARRLLTCVAVAALLVGSGAPAYAQWRGGGRGWAHAAGPRMGGFGGGGWRRGPAPGGFPAYGGGEGFGGPRAGFGGGGLGPGPGGGRAWRRGQVLPQDYRGADVADPGRYHLRRAPNGYGWVGDGRNAYLMQRSTGMVLDSVPGAYDPPPPPPGYGRRR